jgi:hypothetical protein
VNAITKWVRFDLPWRCVIFCFLKCLRIFSDPVGCPIFLFDRDSAESATVSPKPGRNILAAIFIIGARVFLMLPTSPHPLVFHFSRRPA